MATIAPEIPVLARDEAFEKLYRQYVKDVYHYALALLRNPADAEDVTQTTFLNAYRAFQRGEEVRKPQNWLIKIAHNVARSRYARASRRVKEVPLEDHVDRLALPEDERPDLEAVLRALGRLPFNQRAALVMRELEGRSYTEIADTLDVSVPAVETLIFRARRSLRVRAAALKSIAAVPLPGSLSQFFEGGGAVAGGIGAGFVAKAAVALVVGSLATGLGSEHSNRAAAASEPNAAAVAATRQAGTGSATTTAAVARAERAASKRLAVRVRLSVRRSSSARSNHPLPTRTLSRPAATTSAPNTASSSASAPAPAPAAAVKATADRAVEKVDETVAAVSEAIPVSVPAVQTPVQPPPLPKLP